MRCAEHARPTWSVCRADDAPCPAGFDWSAEPPGVDDDRCSQLEHGSKKAKICLRSGSLSVLAQLRTIVYAGDPIAYGDGVTAEPYRSRAPIPLHYERCMKPTIEVGGRSAFLVIESGESWTLDVDAGGQIRGRVAP
jgi:hypothetical protein